MPSQFICPKLPKHTCPEIDAFLRRLRRFAAEGMEVQEALGEIREFAESMREANAILRLYGEYWETKADGLELELSEAKAEMVREKPPQGV